MARRFGRLWSIAAGIAIFLIILASIHTLRPLRNATSIAVEPEPKDVLQDQKESEPVLQDQPEPVVQEHALEEEEYKPVEANGESHNHVPEPAPPEAEHKPAEDNHDQDKPVEDKPTEDKQGEAQTSQTTITTTSATSTPTELSKIIVMGKLQTEETEWVGQELSDWQNAIYLVDLPPDAMSPTGFRTKMNKAREAMAYLSYIIDHYPKYPDIIAFIHPHRRGMPQAWHTDARGNDGVNMMRDLKLGTVVDRGYVNLRCNNEVGCPDEVQPFRDPPDPEKNAEHAFPYIYANFFNATFASMREQIPVVATPCCAQFAVTRAQLLQRPKHEYERYRKFLEETHYDDATSGRVMEYMWHIIFGRDAVHCENMFDCWCAVYGRCYRHGRGFLG